MTITPAVYLAILAAVVCLYWSAPSTSKTIRATILVCASSAVVLIISPMAYFVAVSTALISAFVSRKLASHPSKRLLIPAIGAIVSILITTRASSYFESSADLVDLTGSAFFSLKAIAIISDAYRFSRVTRPLDALLLILFFPIYEAGPIEQPQTLNRFKCQTSFEQNSFLEGTGRILIGLAKQSYLGPVLIGGLEARFSPWNLPLASDSPVVFILWLLLKWAQLYLLFSGYSDVAIGSAKLFGIKVRENFNLPFLATNLQDFWKRWHISLIDFMSQYVYQPFVRKTGWRYRGIMLLFLLTGLWHAFNAQYLLWGVLHGTVMVAMALWQRHEAGHRYRQWIGSRHSLTLATTGLSRVSTVIFVAWVSAIGSAETWERALHVLTFGAIK